MQIMFIRTLITGKPGTEPGRSIEQVSNTGQYLQLASALRFGRSPGKQVAGRMASSGLLDEC